MADKAEKRPLDEAELDRLFEAARSAAPAPSDALLARVMAEAEAEMPVAHVAPAPPARRRGWLAGLIAGVGGWPAAAGLVGAAVTGVAIGVASPQALERLSGGYLSPGGYALENLMPSYAGMLGEG
ncbi:hypothetical protein P1J78_19270 [Psychromarinibacter sp. C21-152]|uniref:Dihydroorotate dehydrogenase n=1 Tax=Psychromarinibacter sediminicola TaxID=3033385 RepID=A0AAE3TAI2_9RHOB|nr:hypothetical protein [Psychromarinibacter sediminicola]MDF0602888.1 hypothetical protein [Psychromarinibacter sediminicola]